MIYIKQMKFLFVVQVDMLFLQIKLTKKFYRIEIKNLNRNSLIQLKMR